ncbi:PoNe immunity protein domain-containing protein [Cupriavidus gilardii]|uniref:PoNe immunity protein domain-containing protein n=1 Tax=Cupriavidus gilardii TaxID=82541 RepID=UPI001E4670BC|nr:PoNe immunity protein domain-containing protein [Cupriavidus gilardii]
MTTPLYVQEIGSESIDVKNMTFQQARRQKFLSEATFQREMDEIPKSIALYSSKPSGAARSEAEGWALSYHAIANATYERLSIRYTAGDPIECLHSELEAVLTAYEEFAKADRALHEDSGRPAFIFTSADDYSRVMQLIGLCYLLHRRDLLPRVSALCDGFRGEDAVYEDLLSFALPDRPDVDEWFWDIPYGDLVRALHSESRDEELSVLTFFLKRWYKGLSGTAWHDTHKSVTQAGHYGYWSFEAGAAVLLLGIEDDTSLHSFPYYPKDLVVWAKANIGLQDSGETTALRCGADQGRSAGGRAIG